MRKRRFAAALGLVPVLLLSPPRAVAQLVCPSPPVVIPLGSSAPITGDTSTSLNRVDTYTCTASAYGPAGPRSGYTGPEDVYEFTVTAPGTNVSFLFYPQDPRMHLLLLRGCDEAACIGEGGCGEALAPGTYHLVVDGLNGAAAPYTLHALVTPSAPYAQWWNCPECALGCGQNPDLPQASQWSFNSGNSCGTGCDFSMFAVVECGTEFHVPLWNVETGHMRVFDVLRQQYVSLRATNQIPANPALPPACQFTTIGTRVEWLDQTCPPGGGDCRTSGVVMDVSWLGSPVACGVFRLDFLDWGGSAWEAYANCFAGIGAQYPLYRDLCSALADYRPRADVGISGGSLTVDESGCALGTVRGTITLQNVGCIAAKNYPLVVEQAPPLPANPRFFLVDLAAGASVSVPWDYTTTFRPADLVFRLDPANVVSECSEAGAKSCGGTSLIRQTVLRVCSACDLTAICASPSVEVCDGAPVALEGSATGLCVGGSLEFRWEDDGGIAFPGCDWNPSPTCIVNPGGLSPGIHLLTFRVRCSVSACESSCTEIVNVLANRMPPPYGNTLRAVRRDADVGLLWILPLGSDISAHRVYQDQDRRLPVATRTRLLEVAVPTATHVNGVVLPPQPIGYYQVVGLSCLGDLEGPY